MTAPKPSEPQKPRRRFWPWVLTALVAGILVAGGAWIVLQATIAGIVEAALRDYAARHGFSGLSLEVRQITPWHAEIQSLRVGGGKSDERIGLDHLSVDYSLAGLKAHAIEGIALNGLHLQIAKTGGGWTLTGLPPRLLRPADAPNKDAPRHIRPDWGVKRIDIRNSRLEIRWGAQNLSIPFDLQVRAAGETKDHYRGALVGHPGNQTIRTVFDLNLAQQRLMLEGAAETLDLGRLSQILVPEHDPIRHGRLAVAYQARLSLDPPSIETAAINIRLPDRLDLAPAVTLKVLNPHEPLATVTRDTNRTWSLNVPGVVLTTPHELHVTDLKGRLTPAADQWRWNGELNLALQPRVTASADGVEAPNANRLPITYHGEWMPDGRWSLVLDGVSTPWALGLNPDHRTDANFTRIDFTPRLSVRAGGQAHNVHIQGTAHLTDIKGQLPGVTVRIPNVVLEAMGEGPWRRIKGRYDLKTDNLSLHTQRFQARAPRLAITGAFAAENQFWRLSGQTRLSRAAFHLPDQQLHLEGLRLQVPFSWPYAPSTTDGTFTLTAATWKEIALGAVRGKIRQREHGADVHIFHESRVIPGGTLQLDGRLKRDPEDGRHRMDFDYRFARPASPDDIDLGQLMSGLTGIQFNGRLHAEGRGTYHDGQMRAGLALNLVDGRLLLPEQKGGLVGLQGAIAFPDLLAMRTTPRQSFFFERAYIGDIAATDGQFDFQIEPGGVFFLEQSQFKWCHGTVYLPATRIVPGEDDYELTLWCDRLKLAQLLEQLGAAQVEGGGTVSGRIPVRFRQGQVLVDNGFLYSSPGEGGTIKLRGTEMLTAGIPPGTPEYTQLELARQALKEYDYRWVKLSLATAPEEDLLRLKLQLDGKPSRPLPFIYDPQAGGFVPAGPDSQGSTFQGISLDVNFSLPLNRLLEYKDLLKLFS